MLIKQARIPVKDVLLYGLLPSWLKKIVYRFKGYQIGEGVSIGFGSVIIGKEVSVGDNTSIGFLTIIRGRKLTIGSHVQIGATTFLNVPVIEIGDGSKINEQVFIGGLQFPDSKFIMGRNCQIMQMSFINPARSITIGDDTGIGGHSLIFGHTSWLSQLEGYEVNFEDIEIGNSVSLAWRVFVLPGAKIGDGSVVGANSLVHREIPPKSLAIGFPARVVGKAPDFPRQVEQSEKVTMVKNIISEMISFFNGNDLQCEEKENNSLEIRQSKRSFFKKRQTVWRLQILYEEFAEQVEVYKENDCNLILSLCAIPDSARQKLNNSNISWVDIENKEQPFLMNDLGEEVALFLKRYGIRLFRVKE